MEIIHSAHTEIRGTCKFGRYTCSLESDLKSITYPLSLHRPGTEIWAQNYRNYGDIGLKNIGGFCENNIGEFHQFQKYRRNCPLPIFFFENFCLTVSPRMTLAHKQTTQY